MNKHETIQQYDRSKSPWVKIGMDLFQIGDITLLVVIDYYSNFLSVEKFENKNCKGILKILLKMCLYMGFPRKLLATSVHNLDPNSKKSRNSRINSIPLTKSDKTQSKRQKGFSKNVKELNN